MTIPHFSEPAALKDFLDEYTHRFNQPTFITDDPIALPHALTRPQDREIMGLWIAILAWGNRRTIIQKGKELLQLMDNAPYQFVREHNEADLRRFTQFKHRTFNTTDALYFLDFFRRHYTQHQSLESAFTIGHHSAAPHIETALINFHDYFCGASYFPTRTRKHISTPARRSACKRLCMFLRWMVRSDTAGVDFGLWHQIRPSQLVCPCDVHVERVARRLGLISRPKSDWYTALELTHHLRQLDPTDPVRYDFALFGLGVSKFFA